MRASLQVPLALSMFCLGPTPALISALQRRLREPAAELGVRRRERSVIPPTYAHLGGFLAYLIASWLLLVLLFRLAAHRKYFFHIVPFVIGYAIVAALLLSYFGFQDFFWWYFTLSSLFFSMVLTRHLKSKNALDAFAQDRKSVV